MFSKLCIRKPVTTIMVTLMVFIAGIVSYFNLDQALMPDMDLPIAVVMTTYVGASPEEIEELISKPMEESLGSIANVDTVTSYSSTNEFQFIQFRSLFTNHHVRCRYGYRHGCGGYAR